MVDRVRRLLRRRDRARPPPRGDARAGTLLWLGAIGVALSLAYTAPPFRLVHRGLGEPVTAAGFGPIMTLGAYFVCAQQWSGPAFYASLPGRDPDRARAVREPDPRPRRRRRGRQAHAHRPLAGPSGAGRVRGRDDHHVRADRGRTGARHHAVVDARRAGDRADGPVGVPRDLRELRAAVRARCRRCRPTSVSTSSPGCCSWPVTWWPRSSEPRAAASAAVAPPVHAAGSPGSQRPAPNGSCAMRSRAIRSAARPGATPQLARRREDPGHRRLDPARRVEGAGARVADELLGDVEDPARVRDEVRRVEHAAGRERVVDLDRRELVVGTAAHDLARQRVDRRRGSARHRARTARRRRPAS